MCMCCVWGRGRDDECCVRMPMSNNHQHTTLNYCQHQPSTNSAAAPVPQGRRGEEGVREEV